MSLSDQWSPTSVQVTVLQARGLRIKGKNGTNDAYAVMQMGKEKYQTSVAEKSVAPVWKEEASFDMPSAHQAGTERGTLHVHVLHRALVGPDKLLGQAVINNLLQLSEDKSRDKTQWYKLLDKSGKPDKDRGELLVDIQFTRNNLTASMFDISAAGKSRSRLGKFKIKGKGKKKEDILSESSSNTVTAFSQVMTDSEEEGDGGEGVAAEREKKKSKVKSLFSHKTNLQKSFSQSMSVLPGKNSSLSGSMSSGLNVEASEGKKKFKFLSHKRTASSDKKEQKLAAEQSNLCINGSHVYCEEPAPRTSRASSNFSLASSGVGSMDDVPDSSSPSVGSRGSVRRRSPWTKEEEEETVGESTQQEDEEMLRRQDLEKLEECRMEEEQRREEEHRMDEENRRQEKMRIEQERLQKEEEEKRAAEMARVEEERKKREEEERIEEQKRMEEELKKKEFEEKERVRRGEEERIRLEDEQKRREEEEEKRQQEEMRLEAERIAVEMRRQEEREEQRKLEEERARKEKLVEEERKRREEQERKEEELRIEKEREEEQRIKEARKREEDERKRLEEEEKIRLEREKEQELQQEQERIKEIKVKEEEKMRLEKERAEEKMKRQRKEEEEQRAREEEKYEQLRAEQRKLEEEERRMREEALEKERLVEERLVEERLVEERLEKERLEKERLVEEERRQEEERRRQVEEEEERRRQVEEEESRRQEKEEGIIAEETQRRNKNAPDSRNCTDVTSTNPFDESDDDNLQESGTENTGRVTSARQRLKLPAERNTSSCADVSTTQEKRQAPKPPRISSSRRQQDALHEAQVNQQGKDKPIKTASVLPRRAAQSSSLIKNNQPEHFSRTDRSLGRRPAPPRPSLKEEEHKDPPLMSKQTPAVFSLNPFEDGEDVDELDDTTAAASAMQPPSVRHRAVKDTVSSIQIKSSKTAHAPAPPAITTNAPSIDTCHAGTISDISEKKDCAPVQLTSPKESCPVQEEAGIDAPPVPSRRLQPVRPLNPQDQEPVSSTQDEKDKKFTGEINGRGEENVKEAGPYALLTQEELISLALKQESQLVEKSKKISELEQYIDHLLVRVIEEAPNVLMTMMPLK